MPHAAARRLGAAFGRVAGRSNGAARRRGSKNLRAAFPELEPERIARLTSDAFAHWGEALFDGVSACRFDSRALCRRLTLAGWSYLDAAERRASGILVLGADLGSWQLAALAVGLYRGPIETLGPWRDDAVFGRLAACFERRAGLRLFGELAGGGQLEWALRAGDRVGFLADRVCGRDAGGVPFLGRAVEVTTSIAQASIDAGAPVVPVFGRTRAPGGWRVETGAPIDPVETDAQALTARYLAAVEGAVRRRPELWPWWR